MSAHRYQVRVGCHLDARMLRLLGGDRLDNLPDGDALIHTPALDQAALHGLLHKVRDLHLTLISIERFERKTS